MFSKGLHIFKWLRNMNFVSNMLIYANIRTLHIMYIHTYINEYMPLITFHVQLKELYVYNIQIHSVCTQKFTILQGANHKFLIPWKLSVGRPYTLLEI